MSRWIQGRLRTGDAVHIAIDGKTARGSRDGDTPAVHLVAAYAPDAHAILAQLRVDAKTNEHKAALELLGMLPIKGKIITGDAMFTHHDVCATVIERGGTTFCRSRKTNRRCGRISRLFSPSQRPAFPPSSLHGVKPRLTGHRRLTKGTAASKSAPLR